MELIRDGRSWAIGTGEDVAWIKDATTLGRTIESAIPAVFAAYATLIDPEWQGGIAGRLAGPFAAAVLEHLGVWSSSRWWLGYLDPGSDDVVFPEAERVALYARWNYVVVLADSEHAASWRAGLDGPVLPDVIFPEDRSWLISTLWDDSWTCIGGPADLVAELHADDRMVTIAVDVEQDMTPPGHTMY